MSLKVNHTAIAQATEANKVLRNTYMLLGMTLVVSALMAVFAIQINAQPVNFFILLAAIFGFPFAINATANSGIGIVLVFAFTAFMGYVLGPILSFYLSLSNGPEIIATSLGLTAFIFLSLSGYVLVTGKDFSFLGGFLFVGVMVVIGVMLVSWLMSAFGGMQLSGLSLALSAAIVLLMSGFILFHTSSIINGGETNYILATVSLYMTIFNLFVNLLALVGFASRE